MEKKVLKFGLKKKKKTCFKERFSNYFKFVLN